MVALLPQQAAAAPVPNGEVVAATITPRPVAPAWKMALTESADGVRPERRTRFAQDIAAVENGGSGIPKAGISQVIGGMARVARPLCQPVAAAGAKGFCQEAGEVSSTLVHVPQGLTGPGGRRRTPSSWAVGGSSSRAGTGQGADTTDRTVFIIPWPKPELPLRSLTGLGGDLTGNGTPPAGESRGP